MVEIRESIENDNRAQLEEFNNNDEIEIFIGLTLRYTHKYRQLDIFGSGLLMFEEDINHLINALLLIKDKMNKGNKREENL